MGFNRRKMEDQRHDAANKEAATRRATDAQVLEDAEGLIVVHLSGVRQDRHQTYRKAGNQAHGGLHALRMGITLAPVACAIATLRCEAHRSSAAFFSEA